jgi:predicted hydrolase (HD superfamily)
VAARAGPLAGVAGADADLLVRAAWLHDIGYAPALVVTGFHPLDGARYLRDVAGADQRLCRLVANHSCALIGARRCGLGCELAAEFPEVDGVVAAALTYCDMTTSPTGQPVDLDTRLKEITDRYGEAHVVTQSMRQAWPHIQAAERLVRSLMGG